MAGRCLTIRLLRRLQPLFRVPKSDAAQDQTGKVLEMLIFWDQRLVFLATPKTGSTAIETALEPLASCAVMGPAPLKHTDYSAYRKFVGSWLKRQSGGDFQTVALMREPLDWLRSWYRFTQRDDLETPSQSLQGVSFSGFVDRYLSSDGARELGIGTQADFLTCGGTQVDQIFRYEQIEEFVRFLEDRMDCLIELPRVNVPPAAETHLAADQEARLRSALASDSALYDSLPDRIAVSAG